MDGNLELPVTAELAPGYYADFSCLMGKCQYTCCQGWDISFSKRDYLKIKHAGQSKEFSALAQQSLRRLRGEHSGEDNYAKIRLDPDGRCPMLNAEGLCSLQLCCGEAQLPEVCRSFPRAESLTPAGYLEHSCSTGCEAVLWRLYHQRDGLDFVETPLPPEQRREVIFHGDVSLMQAFSGIRSLCIDILQDRRVPLSRRLLLLGLFLRELHGLHRDNQLEGLEQWVMRKQALLSRPDIFQLVEGLPGNSSLFVLSNLKLLVKLTSQSAEQLVLRDRVKSRFVLEQRENGVGVNLDFYSQARSDFMSKFSDSEYLFENLMVNIFFQKAYPYSGSGRGGDIWKNFVSFCSVYSFFLFYSICCQPQTVTELIHVLMLASRSFMHSNARLGGTVDELLRNDSATLAHMAILVQG